MTYGSELSKTQNRIFTIGIIFAVGLLFIALTQPVWNAKKLIQQEKDDCKAVHGILIIDHGMFGDTYSCNPDYSKGVQQ